MTNKAKTTKEGTIAKCSNCAHRYAVQSNSPYGLTTFYYCRRSEKEAPLGFLLTKDNDSCKNFKQRENNGKEI